MSRKDAFQKKEGELFLDGTFASANGYQIGDKMTLREGERQFSSYKYRIYGSGNRKKSSLYFL